MENEVIPLVYRFLTTGANQSHTARLFLVTSKWQHLGPVYTVHKDFIAQTSVSNLVKYKKMLGYMETNIYKNAGPCQW